MTREEAINTLRNIYQTDKMKKALGVLVPELHENEDERIYNEIMKFFKMNEKRCIVDNSYTRWISWLEKHKESLHIPETCKENANSFIGQDEKIRLELLKDIPKVFPYKKAFRYIHWLEKQKEQKPEQYSPLCDTVRDKIREYIANHFIADTVVKTDIKSIAKAMEEGIRLGKEFQKPTEWDNDNRIQYDSVKSGIETFASTYSFNIESKLFPQLTKEQQRLWREEIEQAVIAGSEYGIVLVKDNRYKENMTIDWSEEDRKMIEYIIGSLVSLKCYVQDNISFSEIVKNSILKRIELEQEWLKSFRPQPHWKPSEEQMEALKCAVEDVAKFSKIGGRQVEFENEPYYRALHSLYCNLEKLM